MGCKPPLAVDVSSVSLLRPYAIPCCISVPQQSQLQRLRQPPLLPGPACISWHILTTVLVGLALAASSCSNGSTEPTGTSLKTFATSQPRPRRSTVASVLPASSEDSIQRKATAVLLETATERGSERTRSIAKTVEQPFERSTVQARMSSCVGYGRTRCRPKPAQVLAGSLKFPARLPLDFHLQQKSWPATHGASCPYAVLWLCRFPADVRKSFNAPPSQRLQTLT